MDVQRAEALGPRAALRALVVASRDPRARFLVVGVGSTLVHLAVMTSLLPLVVAEAANATAFVVATQANFAASYCWTWASRRSGSEGRAHLLRRLALFNAAAVLGFGVNSACFSSAHRLLDAPPVLSALMATAVSAVVSFAVTSRLVFAQRAARPAGAEGSASAAVAPLAVRRSAAAAAGAPAAGPLFVLVPAPRGAVLSEALRPAPSSLPVLSPVLSPVFSVEVAPVASALTALAPRSVVTAS
ncbi:GtrA family protein [Quadrisphaera setariae]|uniref:GtrA family protein n=1 Tax=Quadrisphaera setariae TaxID=2593304 RepID=A0A5C8ZG79_9ACTN|nr:GtrA family protein [Quadrisphaera setariae]TXR56289.1 GtrA family protein [Quadrisphaera setariae]